MLFVGFSLNDMMTVAADDDDNDDDDDNEETASDWYSQTTCSQVKLWYNA